MATPKEFKGQTAVYNKNNENGFLPLPVFQNGRETWSCWQFSPDELAFIAEHGYAWVRTLAGAHVIPQALFAGPVTFQTSMEGAVLQYQEERGGGAKPGRVREVWCSVDVGTKLPEMFFADGAFYKYCAAVGAVRYDQNYPLEAGAVYLRNPTPDEATRRGEALQAQWDKLCAQNDAAAKNDTGGRVIGLNGKTVSATETPGDTPDDRAKIRTELLTNSFNCPVFVRKLQGGKEEILG